MVRNWMASKAMNRKQGRSQKIKWEGAICSLAELIIGNEGGMWGPPSWGFKGAKPTWRYIIQSILKCISYHLIIIDYKVNAMQFELK